ncbi:arylsulfatase [Abditibacteriota bacterium]|nr:arylsulfatase [Abditibacteriota bacterium]
MTSKINRREFLIQTGVMTLGLGVVRASQAFAAPLVVSEVPPRKRPNFLFIMADDHAAHAISTYGSRINKTSNIDRIAMGGARLDHCFCTNAICTPSRAAIMTGQYGHINGVRGWENIDSRRPIQTQKLLQAAGYATGMIGKWHLGRGGNSDPQGFDYWEVMPGQGVYDDPKFYTAAGEKQYPGYATDVTTDLALNWLKEGRDKDKPFYLCVHHKAPHRNWVPSAKYQHLYEDVEIPLPETFDDDYAGRPAAAAAKMRVTRDLTLTDTKGAKPPEGLTEKERRNWFYQTYIKDYLRCVQSVDDSVGHLLDYLEESGLAQDTVVVYTSDQGFFLGDHDWFDKRFFYEETVKMPFLVRYPREIQAGSVRQQFLANVDFAPTILDYAGVTVPPEMQGISGRAMLRGQTPRDWQTTFYYRYWVNGDEHNTAAHYGVRSDTHKLIYFYCKTLGVQGATELNPPVTPYWELYDLRNDPHEMHNIYADAANAEVIGVLKAELSRLQKKYNDEPQH